MSFMFKQTNQVDSGFENHPVEPNTQPKRIEVKSGDSEVDEAEASVSRDDRLKKLNRDVTGSSTIDSTGIVRRGVDFQFESIENNMNQGIMASKSTSTSKLRSMSKSLKDISDKEEKKHIIMYFWKSKTIRFHFFLFFLPCVFLVWYAAAILFPPEARSNYSLLLWDDGHLVTNNEGHPSMCPRPSICAEGVVQIIMIALARLTAFVSYVFMISTFVSKMHFTIRFLSSTYLMKLIPFESLHQIHTYSAKVFGALILTHAITHYIRYILRSDVDQLRTKVHVSGLCGFFSIIIMIVGMSPIVKKFKNGIGRFEIRFNLHWAAMVTLCLSLCIHNERLRVITLILLFLWLLDYLYGVVFATYNLKVVELLPLPNQSGLQMLWHNPDGFHPKSGEYVKIQIPWLSEGGDEWHPFSIYLRESTERGFNSVHNINTISTRNLFVENHLIEEPNQSLEDFIINVLDAEFEEEAMDDVKSALVMEARVDIHNKFETTQVFICPAGDWSKNLMKELQDQRQLRACWVRGPYTSPYHVAQSFSHLVLTATGIGITPALGVMGQYPGYSRTKVLVWSTRDKNMLKFFAPLITDSHLAVIYYTGKEELSDEEVFKISSYGNIFLQQSRPKGGFGGVAETIIVEFENHINLSSVNYIKDIDSRKKAAWCVLYCGGSVRIRDELKDFSKGNGLGFESELFDW